MNDIKTDRRGFLKKAGIFLSGAVLYTLERLFPKAGPFENKRTSLQEAMHYRTDDTLAG